jgi:hypothetical protein
MSIPGTPRCKEYKLIRRPSAHVPSALVGHQFFLKDGCSLLKKVDLEKVNISQMSILHIWYGRILFKFR